MNNLLNQMTMENKTLKFVFITAIFALIFSIIFALLSFGITSYKSAQFNNKSLMTITGAGEVKGIPDKATINVTMRASAPLLEDAQKVIDERAKNLVAELDKMGVEKKNIKSISYFTNPKYETQPIDCKTPPCGSEYKMIGYEAAQTMEIKISKIELAADVIKLAGSLEINEISGPNFAIENPEKFKSAARILAIKNSKSKADDIAKAMRVKIGKVVKFEEDVNVGGFPKAMMAMYGKADIASAADSSEVLQQGEEIIKSTVHITYSLE